MILLITVKTRRFVTSCIILLSSKARNGTFFSTYLYKVYAFMFTFINTYHIVTNLMLADTTAVVVRFFIAKLALKELVVVNLPFEREF